MVKYRFLYHIPEKENKKFIMAVSASHSSTGGPQNAGVCIAKCIVSVKKEERIQGNIYTLTCENKYLNC